MGKTALKKAAREMRKFFRAPTKKRKRIKLGRLMGGKVKR